MTRYRGAMLVAFSLATAACGGGDGATEPEVSWGGLTPGFYKLERASGGTFDPVAGVPPSIAATTGCFYLATTSTSGLGSSVTAVEVLSRNSMRLTRWYYREEGFGTKRAYSETLDAQYSPLVGTGRILITAAGVSDTATSQSEGGRDIIYVDATFPGHAGCAQSKHHLRFAK